MNEPAFPSHGSMGEVVSSGMSLRDYFAAAALQGIFAANQHGRVICTADADRWAECAYAHADAMLRERAK